MITCPPKGFEAIRGEIKRVYGHFTSIVMGCGCKRRIEFEDTYGVKQEESLFDKTMRNVIKILLFLMTFFIAVIVLPFALLFLLFKQFFLKDTAITIPKSFLGMVSAVAEAKSMNAAKS